MTNIVTRKVLAILCSSHLHFENVEIEVETRIVGDAMNPYAESDLDLISARALDVLRNAHPKGVGPWNDTADTFELHMAYVAITDGILRGRILPIHQVEFETTMKWKQP